MKTLRSKLFIGFLFTALLFGSLSTPFISDSHATAEGFGATCLTGGTAGCLDAINGALLSDGDKAIVSTATLVYFYNLDADSAAGESSPAIISPDTNAGDKRWLLQERYVVASTAAGDMIYFSATNVRARLAAGATTEILVGGGAAVPVWTTATGTGAPVRADTPTLTGRVGIRTPAPTALLDITNANAGIYSLRLAHSGGNNAGVALNVASDTYSNYLKFEVADVMKWQFMTGASVNFQLYDGSDSSVAVHVAPGGTSWVAGSDRRLKKNIVDDKSRLSDIVNTRVRKYKWKRSNKSDVGFIAQELYQTIPEAVEVGDDEVWTAEEAAVTPEATAGELKRPWGISYTKIIPALVKSVQELHAMVVAQQAEIEALKNK